MNTHDDSGRVVLRRIAEQADVPPLPYESVLRSGRRRRLVRNALAGTGAVAAVAAAALLIPLTGGGAPRTVAAPPSPTARAVPRPEGVPVLAPPSGTVRGLHWSLHIVPYQQVDNGGPQGPVKMYCVAWKPVVDGREDRGLNGPCSSQPTTAEGGGGSDITALYRNQADRHSEQIGDMFWGAVAEIPQAATLRATWGGGTVTGQIFRLSEADPHHYYALVLPYVPGHPEAYNNVTLSFLDRAGRVVGALPAQNLQELHLVVTSK